MLFGEIELVFAGCEDDSLFSKRLEDLNAGLRDALADRSEGLSLQSCSWSGGESLDFLLDRLGGEYEDKVSKAGSFRRDRPARLLVLIAGKKKLPAAGDSSRLHQILRKLSAQEIDGIVLGPSAPSGDLAKVPNWVQHQDRETEQWLGHIVDHLERVFAARQTHRPEMERRWFAEGFSTIGRRANNEDSYAVFNFDVNGVQGDLLVVCDGVGGSEAGELASRTAIERLPRMLAEVLPLLRSGLAKEVEALKGIISDHVLQTCSALKDLEDGSPGISGFSTTLVGVLRLGDEVLVFWSGDSRCYRLRAGCLELLSRDHSVPMEMQGLNPDDAETAADKRITRFLSAETTEGPDYELTTSRPGDLWLVCSDGITSAATTHRYLESYLILSMVHGFGPSEAVEAIVQSCWRTISDNSTGVVAIDGWPELQIGSPPTPATDRQAAALADIEPQLLEAIRENAGKGYEDARFPFEDLGLKQRFLPLAPPGEGQAVVSVYDRFGNRSEHLFSGRELTIGRPGHADIPVEDPLLGAVSARLTQEPSGSVRMTVEDVDGGVWIESGARAENLKPGDRFKIGTHMFRLETRDVSS